MKGSGQMQFVGDDEEEEVLAVARVGKVRK